MTLFCSMMEEIRAEGSMKAMSVHGRVGCLPGRTIAFRTSILKKVMKEFMNETFMGFHKEVSDDRSLTNLTLKLGYKTVVQDTSVVYTDAPLKWKKFVRQQLRWAEGSQYNNLRMLGWMWRNARLTLYLYLTDMLTPFFLVAVLLVAATKQLLGLQYLDTLSQGVVLTLLFALLGAALSVSIRQIIPIVKRPLFLLYMPAFIFILTLIMVPVRIFGFAKCADDMGWGTRKAAYSAASNGKQVQGGASEEQLSGAAA